jgi:hypothetical protein
LLVDSGCPRPGSSHERRGHFGESVSAYLTNVSVKARWNWLTVSRLWNLWTRLSAKFPNSA